MAINDLAPGFVLLHYTSALSEHKATIPVDPFYSSLLSQWFLNLKNSPGGDYWHTAVDRYIVVAKALCANTINFSYAELFTKSVGVAPVFVDTYAINVVGTNATAANMACEMTFSYRNGNGGNGRAVILDNSFAANQKYRPSAYGGAAVLAMVNFLVGNTSFFFSRSGSYPINIPQVLTKTNDVLRKKYGIS